ncbi:hypothetical protein CRE_24536 [Caenorhabditis remanei]|uniref:Uncharacterized protein n=1 Tax=Caenorhabditis remanei TaxID=31234 RepID=E3MV98_CAERE|nr:hypothetical protein CRE_24536 [Caenorhabditis remanei]
MSVMSTEEALQRLDEAEIVIKESNTTLVKKIRTEKRKNELRRLAIREQEKEEDEFRDFSRDAWVALFMILYLAVFVNFCLILKK